MQKRGASNVDTALNPILLEPGLYQTLRLDGTGWGRFTVVSPTDITLNVSVKNPTFLLTDDYRTDIFNVYSEFDNLQNASDPGGVYNAKNHTKLFLFDAKNSPISPDTWAFSWIGMNRSTFGYSLPSVNTHSVMLTAGEPFVFLVSTTVSGYSVDLQGGVQSGSAEQPLRLGPHPDSHHMAPQPTDTSVQNTNGLRIRERSWTAGPIHVNGSALVMARFWEWREGNASYAAVEQDERGIAPSQQTSVRTTPDLAVGAGSGNAVYLQEMVDAGEERTAYWKLAEKEVGLYDTNNLGLVFLTIPLE